MRRHGSSPHASGGTTSRAGNGIWCSASSAGSRSPPHATIARSKQRMGAQSASALARSSGRRASRWQKNDSRLTGRQTISTIRLTGSCPASTQFTLDLSIAIRLSKLRIFFGQSYPVPSLSLRGATTPREQGRAEKQRATRRAERDNMAVTHFNTVDMIPAMAEIAAPQLFLNATFFGRESFFTGRFCQVDSRRARRWLAPVTSAVRSAESCAGAIQDDLFRGRRKFAPYAKRAVCGFGRQTSGRIGLQPPHARRASRRANRGRPDRASRSSSGAELSDDRELAVYRRLLLFAR